MKGIPSLLALTGMITLPGTAPALAAAPTAHIAQMCRQQAIEAHPTQRPGAEQGSAQAQRDYFRDCVSKMQQEQLVLTDEERLIILRNVRPRGGSTLGLGALSEGADVPHGVNLLAFPKVVVEALPKMAAYQYFSVENAIAIVKPETSKVILLIDGR